MTSSPHTIRVRIKLWIGRKQAAAIIAATAALAAAFAVSPLGAAFELHAARPIESAVRTALGRDPSIDPRIKIFVYDDPTVSRLGRLDLELAEWASALNAISARRPALIIIDKLFDAPRTAAESAEFVAKVKDLPLAAGAFVTPEKIGWRPELAVPASTDGPPGVQPLFAYGPIPELLPAFAHVGHLAYEGHGRIRLTHTLANGHTLPHVTLAAARDIVAAGGALRVNGVVVPQDAEGRVAVNLAALDAYQKRTISFLPVVTRARAGKEISIVEPGDYVLILPAMFTGNTDRVEAPGGTYPGGFILVATLQSILSGEWLRPVDWRGLVALLAALAGSAAALGLWSRRFWMALVAVGLGLPFAGIAAFAFTGIMLPWADGVFAFLQAALVLHAARGIKSRLEQVRMEHELATAQLAQESFLPRAASVSSLQVVGFHRAASECSGDWWQTAPLGKGLELILVGDAVGHGAAPSLLTGMAFAYFKSADASDFSVSRFLSGLNDVIHDAFRSVFTMSMFAVLVDLENGTLTFANAGHPFPVLRPAADDDPRLSKPGSTRRSSQRLLSLKAHGDILGSARGAVYEEAVLQLCAGDQLLLFTDGAAEGMDLQRQATKTWRQRLRHPFRKGQASSGPSQLHGTKRLTQEFLGLAGGGCVATRDALSRVLLKMLGDMEAHDDMTIVVAELAKDWQPAAARIAKAQ